MLPGTKLTTEGRLWVFIVVVLLVVSILKNINLLALLGHVLLAILILSWLFTGRRLNRLEARRNLDSQIFAGTTARLEVRLRNLSSRPLQGIRLEDLGTSHHVVWHFEKLQGEERRVLATEIVLPTRGWYDLTALSASTAYPFGLIRRRVLIGSPDRIVVFPRPGKVSRERLRQYLRGVDPHGERVHRHGWRHETAQADFHGLRPFRPGDSPRWIHWRTSARRGEFMVREFEDVPGDDLLLVIDRNAAPGEDFEELLSLAVSIILEWCQRRGDRLLLAVNGTEPTILDGTTGPEHARKTLECIALLQPESISADRSFVDNLARVTPHSVSVILLTTGESDLDEMLEHALYRPVMHLDILQRRDWTFYTPPQR